MIEILEFFEKLKKTLELFEIKFKILKFFEATKESTRESFESFKKIRKTLKLFETTREFIEESFKKTKEILKSFKAIRRSTPRKGVVYLMGYLILYPLIPYHGTVSGGGNTRPLIQV